MNSSTLLSRTGFAGLFFFSTLACAQGTPGGKPPGPPPEAVAACTGKAVGASVSFTGRRGETVTGICEKIGDVLAARPAGGPPPAK